MKQIRFLILVGLLLVQSAFAQTVQVQSTDPSLQKFHPLKAPKISGLVLKRGDRLAICGDSITEQKMYSRIMEDYLTMCVPELQVTVRQYGWSGERAPGFLARMTNDCLRFKPTLATTCYGMNDHEYRPYEERIGRSYAEKSQAIVDAFKANHVRVILGSPGCVGKIPSWVKSASGTVEDLNLNLCTLRNLDIGLAEKEKVRFADVFWPMLTAGVTARELYEPVYAIAGKDGVHPGWAGHTVMAYAFLKAMGLKGEIGTLQVDLGKMRMKTSSGHKLLSTKDGMFEIESTRYPFCPCLQAGQATAGYPVCGQDEVSKDSSIRSAMTLVPFNEELNRFILIGRNGKAATYRVAWGYESKSFTAEQLARGINLAAEFPCNPFCDAFARVDAAVAAKQAYETKQVKQVFHGAEGKVDMAGAVARTEAERELLAAAIKAALVPVTHKLQIAPE